MTNPSAQQRKGRRRGPRAQAGTTKIAQMRGRLHNAPPGTEVWAWHCGKPYSPTPHRQNPFLPSLLVLTRGLWSKKHWPL